MSERKSERKPGRPRRLDWYQHSTDMKNNPCVRALRRRFGNNGYAVLNYLLEDITRTGELVLNFTPKMRLLYAAEYEVTQQELEEIVDFCVELDLCKYSDDDKNKLRSPYLEEELLKELMEKREKDRQRKENNKKRFSAENNENSTENNDYSTENDSNSFPRKTMDFPRKTMDIPRKIMDIPRKKTHSIVEYSKEHSASVDIRTRETKESGALVDENQVEYGSDNNEDDAKSAANLAAEVAAEVDALLSDPKWKELAFGRFKILKNDEQMLMYFIHQWAAEVKIRGRGHANLADAKEHIKNWLIRQEDKFNKNSRTNGTDNYNGYRSREDMLKGTVRVMHELRAEGSQLQEPLPIL